MRARRRTVPGRGRVSMVSRFTGDPIEAEDNAPGVGPTGVARGGHTPAAPGGDQFFRSLLALQEEAARSRSDKALCKRKKSIEWSAGARRHDIDRMGRNGLDAAVMDHDIRTGDSRCLAQE